MISQQDAGLVIDEDRRKRGVSRREMAELIDLPPVWAAATVLGMHAVPTEKAEQLRGLLGKGDDLVAALTRQPDRAPKLLVGVAQGNAYFECVQVEVSVGTNATTEQFARFTSETERRCPVTQLFRHSGLTMSNTCEQADLPATDAA